MTDRIMSTIGACIWLALIWFVFTTGHAFAADAVVPSKAADWGTALVVAAVACLGIAAVVIRGNERAHADVVFEDDPKSGEVDRRSFEQ